MRGSAVHYVLRGPGEGRVCISGGRVIRIGDRVRVTRPGWFDKVGTYAGRDRHSHRLKVQFEENGRALLLCGPFELTAITETPEAEHEPGKPYGQAG
jgi:hypothetical protein